jgi:hypothetical protein
MCDARIKRIEGEGMVGSVTNGFAFVRRLSPAEVGSEVVLINGSTQDLGFSLDQLASAFQEFVDLHLAPAWGKRCSFEVSDQTNLNVFPRGKIPLVFLDDADAPGALAYHEVTPDGFPVMKVFARTIKAAGQSISVAASHEIAECLVDPATNLCFVGPRGAVYAAEVADPTEGDTFLVQRIPMSNFVLPAWFQPYHRPHSEQFDHLALISKPFQLRRGGYISIFKGGRWSNIFGSGQAKRRYCPAAHHRIHVRRRRDQTK